MTHDEIARELGISRTRVQQLEARAISKLRRHFGSGTREPVSAFLRDYDGKRSDVHLGCANNGANGRVAARVGGRFGR